MLRISIFILKDTLLLEKQRTVYAKTLINQGYHPQVAVTEAQAAISDVQCAYNVITNGKEVNASAIANDAAQGKAYRMTVSSI